MYNIYMKLIELKRKLKEFNVEINDEMLKKLDTYALYLIEYNEKVNLTAITDYEEIVEKHFFDSLMMSKYIELNGTLVDVGTGAGFPGVVLKICFPDLKVLLIEPIGKRCIFLKSLIEKLNLKDIYIENTRGEDFSLKHREEYDFVTARAVSNLNNLIEVCGAMVKENGYFIALRGKDGLSEIENAKKAIEIMGFEVENTNQDCLSDGSLRVTSFLKKKSKTPKSFPRKYSIIKQKPLWVK